MARILYGVMDDGRGHISRSLAIAGKLRDHEIVFVGGEGVRAEMTVHGYSTVRVPVLATELQSQRVSIRRTVGRAVTGLAGRSRVLDRLAAVIDDFDPDLIVTDYEYFLPLAARRRGRPCVSLDRQHALTHCRYGSPPGGGWSRVLTVSIIRSMYSAATRYLVCSFVPMRPLEGSNAEVFPPVLRSAVHERRPIPGEHAVVYLRGADPEWLRSLLSRNQRRYIVYGFDLDQEEGNLCFRRGSSEGFLDDLAGCAYLVSNAGHNAVSEALYFGKPVLCFPTRLFYEQLVNAHLVQEAGYGAYTPAGGDGRAAVKAFESELPRYAEAAAAYVPWQQETVVSRLEDLLAGRSGSMQTGRNA